MSNYPAGVTGSEYEVSGPQDSYIITEYVACDHCGWEGDYRIDVDYYDGEEFGNWMCETCGEKHHYSHYPEFDWIDR